MTNDLNLAGFLTSVSARSRITFGDVRRLQRDYLPCGIEKRAEAEMLTALVAKVERTDRSWKQWFAAALADFATKSAAGSAAARDEIVAWLDCLSETPGFARRTSRKIARQLRDGAGTADTTGLATEEASVDAVVPQEPAAQHDVPDETERRRRTRAAKRSRIIVRRPPSKRTRLQHKREAMPYALMPTPWVWSGLMGAQQLQVHLAAPFR